MSERDSVGVGVEVHDVVAIEKDGENIEQRDHAGLLLSVMIKVALIFYEVAYFSLKSEDSHRRRGTSV